MNAMTIGKVIGDLQMMRNSARRRAVDAYDTGHMQRFEYWTGQADGLAEAVDRLLVAVSTIEVRNMAGKGQE